jgi:haloalkane dehalogenase
VELLRTPDDRFDGLVDFEFEPHHAHVIAGDGTDTSIRVHYLDEGPRDGTTVLLMHGEPSWSYLYRKMIPPLVAAGCRCVAPDLVGFGRSDKPVLRSDHTYGRHVAWMSEALFGHLDLDGVVMFAQDWGGLIGLRLLAAEPQRFAGAVISNTGLPLGTARITDAFLAWQKFSQESPTFPIGRLVDGGTTRSLSADEIAAYDAPYPDDTFTAGPRQMPSLVPTSADDPAHADNVAAWDVLARFDRPFVCAFGTNDPVTRGADARFRTVVLGAQGRDHPVIDGGGHFIQEDAPDVLADIVLGVVAEVKGA